MAADSSPDASADALAIINQMIVTSHIEEKSGCYFSNNCGYKGAFIGGVGDIFRDFCVHFFKTCVAERLSVIPILQSWLPKRLLPSFNLESTSAMSLDKYFD